MIACQKRERALGTDPLDARDIVRAVPHQCLEFNDLGRGNALFFKEIVLGKPQQVCHAALCHADARVLVNELIAVPIARKDECLHFGEFA